jgi:chemotaxis protein methyltransferase WspC
MAGVETYLETLRSSDLELQELIEAVVVPETWFFRDEQAFAALCRIVIDEWSPGHPARPLRVLSVPCSTGEEPYSIAMALLDAGFAPERFKVDGVDISARALDLARRGVYGRNSFRGASLDFRQRHFSAAKDLYEVAAAVRRQVRFQPGNLLAGGAGFGEEPYDVIFCRNVLIYFDAPTQNDVISLLDRLLGPAGILFVGPAEAFLVRGRGFVSAGHACAFAYRKPADATRALPATAAKRKKGPLAQRRLSNPARKLAAPASSNLPPIPEGVPVCEPAGDLSHATQLANEGRMAEAAAACEAHLQHHGATAAAFYLLGLVADATGNDRQAAECYHKAIYLDPHHAEALIHLALLSEKHGDPATARRLRMRSQRAEEGALT